MPFAPPGPNDSQWADIIKHRPDLAPAITDEEAQRVFRGMADDVATKLEYRADALRLLGNGVVPLCVAYAFVTLVGKTKREG